jgi:hypothetical protein
MSFSLVEGVIGVSFTAAVTFDADADADNSGRVMVVVAKDHKPILRWQSVHWRRAFSGLSVTLLGSRKVNSELGRRRCCCPLGVLEPMMAALEGPAVGF